MATFRNRMAAFLWGFAAAWLSLLGAMTYVYFRDGPPPGAAPGVSAFFMAFFWLGGVGLLLFVCSKPCILVTAERSGTVSVTWRYPHKTVRKVIPHARLLPTQVVTSEDSEGAPYYYARMSTLDGDAVDLAEGHNRAACERARERFDEILS